MVNCDTLKFMFAPVIFRRVVQLPAGQLAMAGANTMTMDAVPLAGTVTFTGVEPGVPLSTAVLFAVPALGHRVLASVCW